MNQKNPQNITPKEFLKWLKEDSSKLLLIDVREKNEVLFAPFPSETLHFPLSKLDEWVETYNQKLSIDNPIVIICHSGIRSWNFGVWLIEQDNRYNVWNLSGGIDAWSLEIDNYVPRY